jgi:hypothetical protein
VEPLVRRIGTRSRVKREGLRLEQLDSQPERGKEGPVRQVAPARNGRVGKRQPPKSRTVRTPARAAVQRHEGNGTGQGSASKRRRRRR